MKPPQRGGFVLGLVAGLLIGLSLALGVALYITKAPVPFVNKVPQRTAEQDQAEIERNRSWDPNAPLAGKNPRPAAGPVASAAAAVTSPASGSTTATAPAQRPTARDPAAILSGAAPTPPSPPPQSTAKAADPFVYFVQAGAYTRVEEAEQQRAKLAMVGQTAKITEREQQGRAVFRVRLGPFESRGEADAMLAKLQESSIDGQLVRVERP